MRFREYFSPLVASFIQSLALAVLNRFSFFLDNIVGFAACHLYVLYYK